MYAGVGFEFRLSSVNYECGERSSGRVMNTQELPFVVAFNVDTTTTTNRVDHIKLSNVVSVEWSMHENVLYRSY